MAANSAPQTASEVETTFVEEHLVALPLIGSLAAPVLLNSFTLPLTKKADPLVKLGIEKATPYIEQAKPIVADALARVNAAADSARAAPGLALEKAKAAPTELYEGGKQRAAALSQKLQDAATSAKETAASTKTAVKEQVVAAPGKAKKVAAEAAAAVRAAPGKAKTAASETVAKLDASVKETVVKTKLALKHGYDSLLAAPRKVYDSIVASLLGAGKAIAARTQPVVHRAVNFASPYAKATAENERISAVYNHKLVQGSIQRVNPLVSKVKSQPTLVEIAKQVSAWALPAM